MVSVEHKTYYKRNTRMNNIHFCFTNLSVTENNNIYFNYTNIPTKILIKHYYLDCHTWNLLSWDVFKLNVCYALHDLTGALTIFFKYCAPVSPSSTNEREYSLIRYLKFSMHISHLFPNSVKQFNKVGVYMSTHSEKCSW